MDAPSMSSMDEKEVYSTPVLVDNAVMATLDVFGYNNGYRNRIMRFGALNTDVEWYNTPSLSGKDQANANVGNYGTSASNTNLNNSTQVGSNANNLFEQMYTAIERANTNIKGLEANAGESPELNQLLGESLAQRAVFYMELTKFYGDVPARWTITNAEEIYLPRTSSELIYNQLLKDLDRAITLLPWAGAPEAKYAKNTTRMGKDFAKALRARVALYAAGYGLHDNNGEPDYRLNQLPDFTREQLYQIAYKECTDVIDHSKANGVILTEIAFGSTWKEACEGNENLNRESLWEIPFINGRGQLLYAYAPKYAEKTDIVGGTYGGQVGPLPSFFYSFASNDCRRNVTCVPYQWKAAGPEKGKINALSFGKVRYEYLNGATTSLPSGQDDGVNFIYMRLADVYMMAAEAANELNDLTNAKKYILPIVQRAYGKGSYVNDLLNGIDDKTSMFNLIVDERGKEFAGEMIRKFDLIRWGNIDQKLAEAKAELKKMVVYPREAPYDNLPNKVYFKVTDNTITMYGLNFGDEDEVGKNMEGYTGSTWLYDESKGESVLTDDMIEGLFVKQPSTHCVWPIPQCVIDANMGYLNNNFLK